MIAAAPGTWLYYCFNAEYLFFPFCETRTVGEMLTFHTEERRDAMLTYVVDLYAGDLYTDTRTRSRSKTRIWTGRATTHWPAMTRKITITPRNGNSISSAGCAGAMRSISPRRVATSTASRCSAPSRS